MLVGVMFDVEYTCKYIKKYIKSDKFVQVWTSLDKYGGSFWYQVMLVGVMFDVEYKENFDKFEQFQTSLDKFGKVY